MNKRTEKNSKEWLQFYNTDNDEVLLSISSNGIHEGEVASTVGLLAYENGISEDNIKIRID